MAFKDSGAVVSARFPRLLAAAGAVLAAAGVALSAYAAHAADAGARASLHSAALMLLVHGVALAAIAPQRVAAPGRVALGAMLAGTLLFAGSVVGAHALATSTRLAPIGGGLLIASWLALAVAMARR